MILLVLLVVGLLAIACVSGLGRLCVRLFFRRAWPSLHLYLAVIMLSGIGCASAVVQFQAIVGTNLFVLRCTSLMLLALGLVGHLTKPPDLPALKSIPFSKLNVSLALTLTVVFICCLAASLAPSSKIDELFYHMLVGRRIVEDGGLLVYQGPVESTILAQIGYQIAQSVFYAWSTLESGNLLSLSFALVLLFFIHGTVVQETGNAGMGFLAAAVTGVGLYQVVFYVTGGPHSLGDLATAVGAVILLWPNRVTEMLGARGTILIAAMASAIAASTKISMIPVSVLLISCVLLRLRTSWRDLLTLGSIVAAVWAIVLGPLIGWAWIHTGAPFGSAFARYFGRTVYEPVVFATLESFREVNQVGFMPAIKMTLQSFNVPLLALFCAGLIICLYRRGWFLALFALVGFQCILIGAFLPHDFRFLGGLQNICVITALLALARVKSVRLNDWGCVAILLGLIPWVGAEMYYSRPFLATNVGAISRSEFLSRYVPFMDDFRKLAFLLPAKCQLYVPNARPPSIYFPRPVIYSLSDRKRDLPLYEFVITRGPGESVNTSSAGLVCAPEIYHNPAAVIEAYRTPGLSPLSGTLTVRACDSTVSIR